MSDRIRCGCRRCTIRGLMWPAIIITIGLLFLLSEMHRGNFDLGNTYPVILIVIGAISLAAALAPMDGHIDGHGLPAVPPAAPGSASTPSENPLSGPGQGQ